MLRSVFFSSIYFNLFKNFTVNGNDLKHFSHFPFPFGSGLITAQTAKNW